MAQAFCRTGRTYHALSVLSVLCCVREQQQEAEAVRRTQAEAAAREQAIERAELEAAQAAEEAAAAARAAANRAQLEAFQAETLREAEAKRQAAVARQEQERQYTEKCKRVSG